MTINRNLSILAGGVSSAGVLGVPNGGSGATTLTGYLIGNGTGAFTASATIPTSSLSGTVNLTSQVSGILPVANGGTGLTSFTAGYVHYGSFSTSANLQFDGTNLSVSGSTKSGSGFIAGTNTDPVNNGVNGTVVTTSGINLRSPTNTNLWGCDGTSGNHIRFFTSGVTAAGIISSTGSITTYGTTSDIRLKTDLGLSTDTTIIDNTEIHNYSWNSDGALDRGVFAQDAYKIKPSAICPGTDNPDGTIEVPWQVDYSKYVPDLIVYCQQLKATIATLQDKLKSAGISGF